MKKKSENNIFLIIIILKTGFAGPRMRAPNSGSMPILGGCNFKVPNFAKPIKTQGCVLRTQFEFSASQINGAMTIFEFPELT